MSLRSRRRAIASRMVGPLSRLTTRGRGVLAAGVTAMVCSLLLGQRDLLRVGVLLTVVPLLTVVVLGRSRYRLACSRTISPSRVEAGAPAQVVVEVANVSGSRCGLVLAEEQVPYTLGTRPRFVLPGLETGERRAVSYTVRSDVRGRFAVGPLSLTLTDPFGMGEHRRSFTATDEIVVVPVVTSLPAVTLTGDWTGSGDTRPRAVAAAGEDDVTTREYHQGDDLRRVHWRSTARHGELMVRREEQPWQSRATLLLDRRRAAYSDGADGFEWSVAAVASVAVHLVGRGYAVRMVDGDTEADVVAQTWAGDGAAGTASALVLDRLAEVAAGGALELARAVASATRVTTGGLLIAVLGALDEQDTGRLAGLNQPGTSCVALLAPVPPGPAGGPRRVAADQHEAQVERLGSAGWDVVAAVPGEELAATWSRVGARRAGSTRTVRTAQDYRATPSQERSA
jgi:hypothetical protein